MDEVPYDFVRKRLSVVAGGAARRVEFDLYEQTRARFDQERIERPSSYQAFVFVQEE